MNPRAWIAEALGTFVLVGIGSLAAVSATGLSQGSGVFVLLVVPFGFGFGLLAAITLFGHVSGGHFNPAVTLAALFDGRVDLVNAIAYAIAQAIGAVLASLMVLVVVAKGAVVYTVNNPSVSDINAFILEAILTTIFVAVILTVTKKQPSVAPLVISLTLVAIHFAAVPISGASVNPARSLGPAIVSGTYGGLWIYLTAPFLGGILGWLLYRFFTVDEDDVEIEVEDEDELEAELAEIR
ncbi:MAG TPA: aquaporin [Candidatus Limnocylindrales bacterium]|jgi:aquaporin Z